MHETAASAAGHVAELVRAQVRSKPGSVLGLATGATMESVYADLVSSVRSGALSLSQVTTFNLDEYAGLTASHPGSYRGTMNALLFDHTDIDKNRCFLPDGTASDLTAEADRYEALIAERGPVDLQLLGIGRNGHIGFNEPGSDLESRTRLVDLHPSTQEANKSFFSGEAVPSQALTMGIATILSARTIVVLATGEAKAEAVAKALSGCFDATCPASALMSHAHVHWVLDRAAAQLLA
ncbi:glucosamine-6-phosphate deaminase [Labrenzia suaedae]|uniref:Glucosamine-6-phosphate deaminase n=1 Tax=Roseibium litorale TaxID=2803841 RepID=A0ABR9CNU2_9HYPH|nr:glucosamine-6-phosphate deaminase [Roseibium litorale]MBD8892289.1 glucosamine-6-phosphate deaminase [Roseibium litorale]